MSGMSEPPQETARLIPSMAALAIGALAATVLPGHPLGIAVPLVMLGALAWAALSRPPPELRDLLSFGLPAIVLSVTPALSAAGWVVSFDLVVALALFSLAFGGGTTFKEVASGLIAVFQRFHRGLGLVVTPILHRWGGWRETDLAPAVRGLVLGASLLFIFGGLLAGADRAFAQIATDVLSPSWNLALLPSRIALFLGTAAFAGALASIPTPEHRAVPPPPPLPIGGTPEEAAESPSRAEWLTPLVLLDLLFAAFVWVQFTVLFGSHRHVLQTVGLTYAEYAREGFFQLLVVAGGTLAVVAAMARWVRAETDRRLLKVVLGILCALTLVILASALRRLGLYEDAFGYTRARVVAHSLILWLGVVFTLLILAGVVARYGWLPRLLVTLSSVAIVGFALISPDALIARRNIDRFEETGKIDASYLASLSADAVPELRRLPEPLRSCTLFPIASAIRDDEPWSAANLARNRARRLLTDIPLLEFSACPSISQTR